MVSSLVELTGRARRGMYQQTAGDDATSWMQEGL